MAPSGGSDDALNTGAARTVESLRKTALRVTAERAMNTRLGKAVVVPIGSYAEIINGEAFGYARWLRAGPVR